MSRNNLHQAKHASRCSAAGIAVTFVVLISASVASAAPTWLTPASLSQTGENATVARVAVDAQGDSFAIWQQAAPSNTVLVQAATRAAGGSWQSTPTGLASCFLFPTYPTIASDAAGDAIAVWDCSDGTSVWLDAAYRPAGGSWQPTVQVLTGSDAPWQATVAMDAQGDAVIAWIRSSEDVSDHQPVYQLASVYRPAGGSWQPEVDLDADETELIGSPVVAIDSKGDLAAAWLFQNGINEVVQATTRPAGASSWSAITNVSSATGAATTPRIAMTNAGNTVVAWAQSATSGATIEAADLPAGGAWGPPVELSASGQAAENPALALDSAGDASAVWDRSNGSNTIVEAAEMPSGGTWQAPVDLSATGESATNAQVTGDARGGFTAVWQRSNGTNTIIEAARHPQGGGWQPPSDVSATAQNAEDPALAADAAGDVTAVWDRSNGTNTIVQAAGLDAAGPQLTRLALPTSGAVGQPLAFSVSPFDVWSPLGALSWDFGDGTSATSDSATHAYARPGRYPVTLTSSDSLGNETSTTATVTIASPTSSGSTGTAPTLTRVSQSHARWRERSQRRAAGAAAKRPPIGTTFRFSVNETARVTLVFEQSLQGRRVSGRCVGVTRRNARKPRCRRAVRRGSLAMTAKAGARRFAFSGKIGKGMLALGSYAVALTATEPANKLRSTTRTLHFTIVR